MMMIKDGNVLKMSLNFTTMIYQVPLPMIRFSSKYIGARLSAEDGYRKKHLSLTCLQAYISCSVTSRLTTPDDRLSLFTIEYERNYITSADANDATLHTPPRFVNYAYLPTGHSLFVLGRSRSLSVA